MTDESIFAAALAIPNPAERRRFLDSACAGNPALRAEVEQLLAAHAADNPLDRPPADLARTGAYEPQDGPPPAAVGDRIGPYRLMEQIGEGGFGLVFVAEQTEPVRRKVALKVLKPGMDTRQVVARFEAERQALALMDHPNIARVLDAGSTSTGRPYFVMELVRGVPITDFCDQQKLPPRERLALFVQVCQAIQHAHQKGVIHRDIKPTNVLVTSHDGVPVPKVIDFGVAKAVGQSLTEKTIYTRFAQMIGTPLYMSPEQAEMSGLDVDTRADVYALGVLLYELLTGTTPFDRDRFRKAAFDEIRRIIREEEPPRPSTRLTSLGATLSAVSASRGTDPGRLAGLVRGELDWIVMKCLEKDRNRRYESASGLAKDVQRYLSGDAVEACPPTLGYRLRKLYRRNRAAVLTAGAFAAVLLAATGMSLTFGVLAKRAEAEAGRRRVEAEAERTRAAESEREVRQLLAEAVAHRRADELRLASADVDLDLKAFIWDDTALALVRMARTLQKLPPHARELREFVAMTLIARGQTIAPLLPPILTGGQPVEWGEITPDGRTYFTDVPTARLWDARTGRSVATLAEKDEPAYRAVLSRDGRVAVTVAPDGVVRFWDVPSGRLRGRTLPLTPVVGKPYGKQSRPEWLLLSDDAQRLVVALPDITYDDRWSVTVWDTATGRQVARLPGAGTRLRAVALSPDGRQVVTCGRGQPTRVWSADDGTLEHTLDMHEKENQDVAFSPSGRRAATRDGNNVRLWHAPLWGAYRGDQLFRDPLDPDPPGPMRYVSEDIVTYRRPDRGALSELAVFRHDTGRDWLSVPQEDGGTGRFWVDGGLYVIGTKVFDPRTGRDQPPPYGKPFHPALTRYAHDGRWYVTERGIYDLATGKRIRDPCGGSDMVVVPGVGFVGAGDYWWNDEEDYGMPAWVPLPSRVPPDDHLILWAHVVACGELGPDGEFVKWDEAKWEAKWRELAARPAPYPDFPFPGRIATDRLHWLRRESYFTDNPKMLPLYGELSRRAEAAGDADEAAYWRGQVARLTPVVAPPPRELKR